MAGIVASSGDVLLQLDQLRDDIASGMNLQNASERGKASAMCMNSVAALRVSLAFVASMGGGVVGELEAAVSAAHCGMTGMQRSRAGLRCLEIITTIKSHVGTEIAAEQVQKFVDAGGTL